MRKSEPDKGETQTGNASQACLKSYFEVSENDP